MISECQSLLKNAAAELSKLKIEVAELEKQEADWLQKEDEIRKKERVSKTALKIKFK